jgi:hypothetical protein
VSGLGSVVPPLQLNRAFHLKSSLVLHAKSDYDTLPNRPETVGRELVLYPVVRELIAFENMLLYEGVSKSFRTGRLERELQMVELSATRCSCIAIYESV